MQRKNTMEETRENFIGACGDNCSCCLRYKATLKQNAKELNRIRDLWVSFGWRNPGVDSKELECFGCRKENNCPYEKLRDCVFEKDLGNCGMCRKYPCELIAEAFDRTGALFRSWNQSCSREDRHDLEKAFNNKKQNLDMIHKDLFNMGERNPQ